MTAITHALQDNATLIGRSVRASARDLESILVSVLLPIMLMCTFVWVFGGALDTGGEYVDYIVPGAILLCAGYGAAQTAVAVAGDMSRGIIDRFRTMPISAFAVVNGHVVASLARNAVATVLVVAVALLLGFGPTASPGEWLAAAGVLGLYVLAISWVSALMGLVAGTPEAASGFTFLVLFLPYISSAFVPTETLPGWLQGFAGHQPVTPVTNTLRELMVGTPGGEPWTAVLWGLGLTLLGVVGSAALFRRKGR
ncbi:ABC transporter permease [Georgenia thermotolerans]|uniref:Transport permease protein n=1 Tax=Georgenia thermotolerans TaxID=527326 RepID=A0A7J5UUS3_9MICO|nr:ABC transporter permease [Georgenia thermotolerans]KAE8766023.1 ABC transporter permease [Georgenia thermotolerans]